jgi:hypothetical protein
MYVGCRVYFYQGSLELKEQGNHWLEASVMVFIGLLNGW